MNLAMWAWNSANGLHDWEYGYDTANRFTTMTTGWQARGAGCWATTSSIAEDVHRPACASAARKLLRHAVMSWVFR